MAATAKLLFNIRVISYKTPMEIHGWGAIGEFLSGLATVAIAISAMVAMARYKSQVELERMKWVQQLYDGFYSSERHKGIRQLIDFDDLEALLLLLRKGDSAPRELHSSEREQIDQFTDYLNFFEWIGYLVKKSQITFEHVDTMFKYYLVRLIQVDKDQELRKYIKGHGYEELHALLNRYSNIGA